jgi:hypothetical protein
MAIRNQDDSLSRVKLQERDFLKKQDKNATANNFDRFIFMTPGNKDLPFDWRLDFSKHSIPTTTFLIDQLKYVNRPDSISYESYGNAKYWWIIAMYNNIKDPFLEFYMGRKLIIPELIAVKKLLGL